MSDDRPLVLFDILGTLGCIVRCAAPGELGLMLYPGVKDALTALAESARARLAVVPVAAESGGDQIDAMLRRAGIADLMARDASHVLPLPTATHFRAEQCAGADVYVSASLSRRAAALDAGLRVAPHCGLVADVLNGEELVYARISDQTSSPRQLAAPSRFMPVYTDQVDSQRLLYAVGPRSALVGVEGATVLERAAVATHTLFFCARSWPAEEDHQYFHRALAAELPYFEWTRHGAVFALGRDDDLAGLSPPPMSCTTLLTDLQPHPIIDARYEVLPWSRDLSLTAAERRTLEQLDAASLRRFLAPWWQGLGELPGGTRVVSRNIFSRDNAAVVRAAAQLFAKSCGTDNVWCESFLHARNLVHDNVVAEIPARRGSCAAQEVIIVSAHLDSIAPNGPHAPGVDDDASGLAAVLATAEVLSRMGRPPERTIRFVLFNAEENYKQGSKAYARCHAVDCATIVGVIQLDMIGGRADHCPPSRFEIHTGSQADFRSTPEVTDEASRLADLVQRTARDLLGESLTVLRCPNPECPDDPAVEESDNVSFLLSGIPACLVCEDMHDGCTKPILNRTIHTQEDLHVNCAYAAAIARAVAGAIWLRANAP